MRAASASLLLAAPFVALAQENPHNVALEDSAFVEQAPEPEAVVTESVVQEPAQQIREDNSSKVYFPEQIPAAGQIQAPQQLNQPNQANASENFAQVSSDGEGGRARDVDQLSDGDSAQALSQLTPAERQVLLEAVEGTDICDRSPDIPALIALCESRIETRSAEFTQAQGTSAEDSLLGGGLDSERVATLEAAIARLAGSSADSDNFSNQVIASVALGATTLTDSQATAADGDPTSELSAETQAVVNAIVQQLGGN